VLNRHNQSQSEDLATMLEELNRKSVFLESFEALVYLIKENPVRSLMYCGAAPFGVVWIVHNSVATGFALQSYLVTTFVFAYEPFRNERESVKHRWFWKVMVLGGLPIHMLFMTSMWYLDRRYRSFTFGGGTLFLLVFAVCVAESIMLGSIVNRFRPERVTAP
jgi:hypothetical protein